MLTETVWKCDSSQQVSSARNMWHRRGDAHDDHRPVPLPPVTDWNVGMALSLWEVKMDA